MRRLIGKIIEWFLEYEHIIVIEDGSGRLPRTGYKDDAGFDLYVNTITRIPPKAVVNIPSGIKLDPKDRVWFEIISRSSTFKKRGLEVQDSIIDNGYRGEMYAVVYNPTNDEVVVNKNERICQIIPHRIIPCRFEFGRMSNSYRGSGGFGSSGR